MDETYRMLGREHQADLEREALKWQRAAEVRRGRQAPAAAPDIPQGLKRARVVLARFAAFVGRPARAEA
jgi:hypothetical protein